MTADDVRTLYKYNDWANHRITSAARPLDAAAFTRDLGNSFGSVRDTLAHIWWAEWIWLERWQGRSPKQAVVFSELPDIDALEKRWADVERNRQSFLERLTDDTRGGQIDFVHRAADRLGGNARRQLARGAAGLAREGIGVA